MRKALQLRNLSPLARRFIRSGVSSVCGDPVTTARLHQVLASPNPCGERAILRDQDTRRTLYEGTFVSLRLSDEHCYQQLAKAQAALREVAEFPGLAAVHRRLRSLADRANRSAAELHEFWLQHFSAGAPS